MISMVIKKIISALSAAFLLFLFLPVFFCTIVIGNNMDYNEEQKIETLVSNEILLMYVLLALAAFAALYFLLSRIPYRKKTMIGTVLFSFIACIVFYIVKVEISKCIAFYGGWDCGMVANSARWAYEGQDIGYRDYYLVYSNNIPITWLLYVLYGFSNSMANYTYNPEFIWIQFQCLMFAAAVFFSTMTILITSRKVAPAVLSLLTGIIFLGLCPWQIIPYTDASAIAVPVLTVFLYALFRRMKSKIRYIVWLLLLFAGMLGGIMKATCYVTVIAVVAVELIRLVFGGERMAEKIRKLAFQAVLLCCSFVLASWCRNMMYKTLDYVPDYDREITWSNYFYNGLNELTTGACSGDGLIIVNSYAECSRQLRRSVELHYARDRIMEKGFGGLIYFWLRKQVMNFNDGTFSWFQEGYFNAWDYEEITDSSLKEPLRDFYWKEEASYPIFTTWSQGLWIFVLLGIIFEAVFAVVISFKPQDDMEKPDTFLVEIVTFIGIFLFVMLFEGRARYLLTTVPVFITMAVRGYSELAYKICDRLKKAEHCGKR